MRVFKIEGQQTLSGTIEVSGAKNSVVALISAAILSHGEVIIEDVPELSDVFVLITMLERLHAKVNYDNHVLTIDTSELAFEPLLDEEVQKLRASYYLMGAMIGRFGKAVVGIPGGCYLGPRPMDLHLKGFNAMAIDVVHENGAYHLTTKDGIIGSRINLDIASVGATINIILAGVYAKGTTYIESAAKEPEIIDVTTLLNSMGAKISGAGTDVIRIEGVQKLNGCRHQIIPDRIVAGSYLLAGALIGDKLRINNVIVEHMEAFLAKLQEAGAELEIGEDYVIVSKIKDGGNAVTVKTMTYPGFPTDLQQPFTVLMTQLKGMSLVHESIYNARFKHIEELSRMGATIRQENATAIINGPAKLQGARVEATDLRAGMAMILAGLIAEGITEVKYIEHVERGYEQIVDKLTAVGAKIWIETV
ncbi:MAG: UDP-N-acetylglucosamine 1-carboxyvinyltransferase [Culicoidibacterales bacterium]